MYMRSNYVVSCLLLLGVTTFLLFFCSLFLHPTGDLVKSFIDSWLVNLVPRTTLVCCGIHIEILFVLFVCFLRAKSAGNSNDTGGTEESDLEKMKQVIFSSFFFTLFLNFFTKMLNLLFL